VVVALLAVAWILLVVAGKFLILGLGAVALLWLLTRLL
jgi:hypothetical protein